MLSTTLFLGFRLTPAFVEVLSSINPQIISLYVNGDDNTRLQEVLFQNERYLGKPAGNLRTIDELSLLKDNIITTIKKIVPVYSLDESSLVLFPYNIEDEDGRN